MFDIHGDEITFRGIHFATINGKAWPTLRDEAEKTLRDMLTESEISESEWRSYDEGESKGAADARADVIRTIEDNVESSFAAAKLSVRAYNEISRILSAAKGG